MVRIAVPALVLLIAAVPASAEAGWSRPERGSGGGPRAAVEVTDGAQGTRVSVRVRAGRRVRVPGSQNGSDAVAALGPGGLVAVAWAEVECVSDPSGNKGSCTGGVFLTRWRRDEAPPQPTLLSREDGTFPDDPALAIARDGTVAVAWNVAGDDYIGTPVRVDAAVARGTGPLATMTDIAPDAGEPTLGGAARVRGAAQLAVTWESPAGTEVALVDAQAGRLGALRPEARIAGGHRDDLQLLRSRRGDRLLAWSDDDGARVLLRHGAPGRPLSAVRSAPGNEFSATLTERGDFGVLTTRDAGRDLVRPYAVRGRTGQRRLRAQGLAPASYARYGAADGRIAIALDGHASVVWNRGLRGTGSSEVFGASAARGGRFSGSVRLSSPLGRAFCSVNSLTAHPGGGAVARWRCNRAGRGGRFTERSRFRPDDG